MPLLVLRHRRALGNRRHWGHSTVHGHRMWAWHMRLLMCHVHLILRRVGMQLNWKRTTHWHLSVHRQRGRNVRMLLRWGLSRHHMHLLVALHVWWRTGCVLQTLLLFCLQTLNNVLAEHLEALGKTLGIGPSFAVLFEGELDSVQAPQAASEIILVANSRGERWRGCFARQWQGQGNRGSREDGVSRVSKNGHELASHEEYPQGIVMGIKCRVGLGPTMRQSVNVVEISNGVLEDEHPPVGSHMGRSRTRRQAVDVAVLELQVEELPDANGQSFGEGFTPFPHVLADLPDECGCIVDSVNRLIGIRLDQCLIPGRLYAPKLE